jgi:dTDP-4-dehydrorhamnose reductase
MCGGSTKMRIAVLGATGMLGHKVYQVCKERFDTWAIGRMPHDEVSTYALFPESRYIGGIDACDMGSVTKAFAIARPDAVVNCIGIIKQSPLASDPLASLEVNALFPHKLAALCKDIDARLIHISTDCVFSGHKGMYTEDDTADPVDLYGRSKYLGEVTGDKCLTLRTSIIGREIGSCNGLLEWFISKRSKTVKGYSCAIFSGLTTIAMARIIADIINDSKKLEGLYQVSSAPISKYELLCMLNNALDLNVSIEQDMQVVVDRSLDSTRFWNTTGFIPPCWEDMISELANDPTPYDDWHRLSELDN